MIDEKKLLKRIEGWKKSIESHYLYEEFLADNSIIIDTLSKVLDVINEQPKTGEWIPVTERLPEELTEVNVTWINREPMSYYADIKDKPFTATCVLCKGKWYWTSGTCVDILTEYGTSVVDAVREGIEITAWMPLPEPYEEDENE